MSNKQPETPTWPETLWHAYLTGDHSNLGPMVHGIKSVFRRLPRDPRCRVCEAPFKGPGSFVASLLGFGAGHSSLNPSLCVRCENIVKEHEVGHEDLTHLYSCLGRTLELNSQFDEALVTYEEMESIARQQGNRPMELAALMAQVTL